MKSILSYYLATKYSCKFIIGEVNYLSICKHLLLKSAQYKVEVTDDEIEYLELKNERSKMYFAKINGSMSKINVLLLEKI